MAFLPTCKRQAYVCREPVRRRKPHLPILPLSRLLRRRNLFYLKSLASDNLFADLKEREHCKNVRVRNLIGGEAAVTYITLTPLTRAFPPSAREPSPLPDTAAPHNRYRRLQECNRRYPQKDSLLRKVCDYFCFLANLKSKPRLTVVLRRLYWLM